MNDLHDELARLAGMPAAQLRIEWRRMFRAEVPTAFSRDLMLRAIAHRIQEQRLGGLAPDHVRLLARLAQGGSDDTRRLKVGTVLVREHKGVLHDVVVVPDGFHWRGSTYPSLSTIAQAITGTTWNGPRFFGLRARSGPSAKLEEATTAVPPEAFPPRQSRPGRRSTVRSSTDGWAAESGKGNPPRVGPEP